MARVKKFVPAEFLSVVTEGVRDQVSAADPRAALAGVVGGASPDPAKLLTVIETADKKVDEEKGRAVHFGKVNGAKEVPIDSRFPALVERAQRPIDWDEVLGVYEGWLVLGDRRTDTASIRKAHEEGPSIIQQLVDVYLQVKRAREKWESENDVILGSMREEAVDALEAEKARGARKKTITEADIKARGATMFPDEWHLQAEHRREYKMVEDRAERAIDVAKLRQKTLDTMVHAAH